MPSRYTLAAPIRAALALALVLTPVSVARADDAPPAAAGRPPTRSLDVWVDKAKVDLVGHSLELKASRALIKLTIKVIGDSGAVLTDDTRTLLSHPANTPLRVDWSPSSDEPVARIEVFVWDAYGFYKGFALSPWSVSIPHEELNFATDSAVIADAEKPKLEASLVKVQEAVARHPELQGVRLFVAGHTDTVGDAGHNLRLSQQRAHAIAQWFRQRGLRIPIGWEGFGEAALLVKTADNVDEPRNRRVDYILAVDEPSFSSSTFHPTWKGIP
jgi:outer membrane protein OmpA-like peptidoglycan-associated protein